jgi:hypothetical protein
MWQVLDLDFLLGLIGLSVLRSAEKDFDREKEFAPAARDAPIFALENIPNAKPQPVPTLWM